GEGGPPPSHSPLQNLRRPCDTATLRARPTPSPSLPARGRVSDRGCGTLPSQPPGGTSPLAGEDGRGVAVRSAPPSPTEGRRCLDCRPLGSWAFSPPREKVPEGRMRGGIDQHETSPRTSSVSSSSPSHCSSSPPPPSPRPTTPPSPPSSTPSPPAISATARPPPLPSPRPAMRAPYRCWRRCWKAI